jgi:hypothetical protein
LIGARLLCARFTKSDDDVGFERHARAASSKNLRKGAGVHVVEEAAD